MRVLPTKKRLRTTTIQTFVWKSFFFFDEKKKLNRFKKYQKLKSSFSFLFISCFYLLLSRIWEKKKKELREGVGHNHWTVNQGQEIRAGESAESDKVKT